MAAILQFDNPDITINKATYKDGQLILETSYTGDLEGKDLGLSLKDDTLFEPGHPDDPDADDMYSTSKVTFTLGSTVIPIKTANNLDAYYYEDTTYQEAEKMESGAITIVAVSSAAAFFCLVLKNSLPLVLMLSSLQLIFFSLATIDGLHPVAESLLHLKSTAG